MTKANFGVVSMAVMGRNLALNIESGGYGACLPTMKKTEDVVACILKEHIVKLAISKLRKLN